MSAVIATHQNQPSRACEYALRVGSAAAAIGANAGIGCIAGTVFSIINPIGGAIFGATYALTSIATNEISNALGCSQLNNTALKIAQFVISSVLGVVAATFAVAAVGFPITFAASAMLVSGMTAITIALAIILGTGLVVTACCVPSVGNAVNNAFGNVLGEVFGTTRPAILA